jgi:hypothetical protein
MDIYKLMRSIAILSGPMLFLCLLSGCGFRPVYSTKLITNNQLGLIEVEPIESIDGAEFCYHLSQIMPNSHSPKYLLKVQFSGTNVPLAMQKNSEVLRQTINQQIHYKLIDKETNKEITSGQFKNISSYSTTTSPYATYVDSEMASKNLSKQAAEEIRSRLILYFANRRT